MATIHLNLRSYKFDKKFHIRTQQSSNQNSVYDGNYFLIGLFSNMSMNNYLYCKTWPFDHKTFEHEFVVILKEKKTANTLSNKYFVLIGQLWSKIKYIHKIKIN